MKRTAFLEGILMGLIGILAFLEGLRLIVYKDPMVVYDVLGPGYYILIISIALIMTGLFHIIANRQKKSPVEKLPPKSTFGSQVLITIAVCAIYIYLITIVGYVAASVIFFLLEFRVMGIKSWRVNFLLTVVLTGVNYLVFVKYCDMVFPRGIFFG